MTSAADRPSAVDAAIGPEIPVEDVTRWHADIADELRAAFEACLPGNRFTLGPRLLAFEHEFAAYCDSAHAIGVSSGTAALALALRALGVQPGHEVITVPNTYIATAFAITYVGAVPVFVDVDPVTANMDPARVANAVSDRTKAIIPVHLWGQAVDIDGVRAAAPGIPILEDAAHAHGATYKGRKVGSLGDVAEFSFYPSKVMGALGDGGIMTTSDPELEARLRQLRYMGQAGVKHQHVALGYQERLDELQAAFLSVKLRHLEDQLAVGADASALHRAARRHAGRAPCSRLTGRHVYYMYTVRAPRREDLRTYLDERKIRTQLIYPTLVPDQGAYTSLPWRAADPLEVARSLEPEILCLPMFAELTDDEVDSVGRAIRAFYRVD